jgi:hypothetical protein
VWGIFNVNPRRPTQYLSHGFIMQIKHSIALPLTPFTVSISVVSVTQEQQSKNIKWKIPETNN